MEERRLDLRLLDEEITKEAERTSQVLFKPCKNYKNVGIL